MKLTIDPVALLAALKSVAPFVSTDETRSALNQVLIRVRDDKKLVAVAADGHTLCEATARYASANIAHGAALTLSVGDVERHIRQCALDAKSLAEATYELEDNLVGGFPNYLRAMPPSRDAKEKGVSLFGVNPEYLARLHTVQKALKAYERVRSKSERSSVSAAIQPPQYARAPLKATLKAVDGTVSAIVVIMPVLL